MVKTVRHIFTFQDHFFKIVSERYGDRDRAVHYLEDELGVVRPLPNPGDLREVRVACRSVMGEHSATAEVIARGETP